LTIFLNDLRNSSLKGERVLLDGWGRVKNILDKYTYSYSDFTFLALMVLLQFQIKRSYFKMK